MKNIKSKIIISILLLIMIILVSTNIQASIAVDGKTYYTIEDIGWNGSQISWNGSAYYCINHNYNLTGGMGNADLTVRAQMTTHKYYTEATIISPAIMNAIHEDLWKTETSKLDEEISKKLEGKDRTFTVSGGDKSNVQGLEAAIYAFAVEFDAPKSDVCNSIWKYQHNYVGNCGDGEDNILWQAANAYQSWEGSDLRTDDSAAKINVNYNTGNYIAGPFLISYNTETYDYIGFTKDFTVNVKDQKGDPITNFKYVDLYGNRFSEAPNGEEFYLEIPYTREITKIDIDVSLDYIESVTGTKTDYYTYVQQWKYKVYDHPSFENTYFTHGSDCEESPGESWVQYGWIWPDCSDCYASCSRKWEFWVAADAKLVKVADLRF